MPADARYDEIADWYETIFLVDQRTVNGSHLDADRLGIDRALVELLGAGDGLCLEVGCGTGIYADRIRRLGWYPVGLDLSAGMLRYAKARLPTIRGDAYRLPIASGSCDAVTSVMVHTDVPDYASVLGKIDRVLKPGGVFVHIGVHPCFCGGFADRSDPVTILIQPGYLNGQWTTNSWTDRGLRDKVGATHLPLAGLLNTAIANGFLIEQLTEGGEPTPVTLSVRLRRPAGSRSSSRIGTHSQMSSGGDVAAETRSTPHSMSSSRKSAPPVVSGRESQAVHRRRADDIDHSVARMSHGTH